MKICSLRSERGWTQEELASRSGISVRTLQRIEKGGKPSLNALRKIAAALAVEPRTLAEESNINSNFKERTSHSITRKYISTSHFRLAVSSGVIILLVAISLNLATVNSRLDAIFARLATIGEKIRSLEFLSFENKAKSDSIYPNESNAEVVARNDAT